MGNIPSTASESIPDDALLRSLENQAVLIGSPLTPPNNKFLRTLVCRRAGETDLTLVKVFFVKNADLSPFREKLKVQKTLLTLESAPNVLAYQRFREGGGSSPAFVARQHVFANLRDRLSTRPFLTDSEKLWIAFCLLSAGQQIHDVGLAHGDIKSENFMLTSWGWPFLTDLAAFKPTFLQADQSAAPFNFFFSTGKKRCYIAPERFLTSSGISTSTSKSGASKDALKRRFAEVMANKDSDLKKAANVLADAAGVQRSDMDEKEAKMASAALALASRGASLADADLTKWRKDVNDALLPSMDVFSIGCVLLELFNADSEPAFEFSDALQYATRGECARLKMLLGKVSNPSMRALIESMTSQDPTSRLSLESYLQEYSHVFPSSFSGFLFTFMRGFLDDEQLKNSGSMEDTLVWRTCEHYGEISAQLLGKVDEEGRNFFEGFVHGHAEHDAVLFKNSSKQRVPAGSTAPPSVAATPVSFDPDDSHFEPFEAAIRELEHNLAALSRSTQSSIGGTTAKVDSALHVTVQGDESEDKLLLAGSTPCSQCSPIIVIISYLCMAVQNATKASTRILAILLIKRLALLEQNAELILSRILPFLVDRLVDASAWVRCTSLRALTELLQSVDDLPHSEAKVFSDYLVPSFNECARDASEAVRVTFASCIPSLATSAKRFLELARQQQYSAARMGGGAADAQQQPPHSSPASSSVVLPPYDAELGALHDSVQKMIDRTVASEHSGQGSDLAVKLGLVSQVVPLCMFFGRDRIDRWLLPWLLSVVNTRGPGNWRLQVAVLRSLAAIGAFAGDEAIRQYLHPFIDDMLLGINSHELVVEAAAHCLTSLVRLGLLHEKELFKLVRKVAPMVRHPALRVRRSTLLLLAAIASSKMLPHVDVQLFVAEKLKPFYSPRNNNEAEKFMVLLGKPGQSFETNALLLEQCLNVEPFSSYDEWLSEFAKAKTGAPLAQSRLRAQISQSALAESNAALKAMVRVHLLKTNESAFGTTTNSVSTSLGRDRGLRDVRNRYGIVLEDESIPSLSLLRRAVALGLPETRLSLGRLRTFPSRSPSPSALVDGGIPSRPPSAAASAASASRGSSTSTQGPASQQHQQTTQPQPQPRKDSGPRPASSSGGGGGAYISTSSAAASQAEWRPRGLLVSSFYEHSGPVNRVTVADDFSFVVTGSDDGTAKVWRTDKLDRNPCPHSRVTFEAQGGRVVDVCAIRGSNSVGVASDLGKVSLVRVDAAQTDCQKSLRCDEASRLVALGCASYNELLSCTERGNIFRWDLRSGSRMDDLALLLGFGSVSCMTLSPDGMWLALGTHRGVIAVFDLRFNMLLAAWRHTCSCAIHRLYCSKTSQGLPLVYVAAGPNQAVLLNVETGETRFAFACAQPEFTGDKSKLAEWKASQESLFSKRYEAVDLQARQLDRYIQEAKFVSASEHSSAFSSPHQSIRALYCPSDLISSRGTGVEPLALLTGGSDMIVRHWDCHAGSGNSSFVSAPPDEAKIKWEAKDINERIGTMFLSLSVARAPAAPSATKSKGKFVVRPAHHDAILDISGLRMASDGSPRLITAGRDNVVRIWK